MSEFVKISVIVPIFNQEQYLRRCLDSIVKQTLKEIEILLVDDGSIDNSPQICREYAKKDCRINFSVISHGGVSRARNHGIKLASGEFIGFVDNDDFLDHDFYRVIYLKAKEHDSQMVYSGVTILSNTKYHKEKTLIPNNRGLINQNGVLRDVIWNKIYKLNTINQYKILFNENSNIDEDTAFVFMFYSIVAHNANSIVCVKQPLYYYCRHAYSTTATFHTNIIESIHKIMRNVGMIIEFYEKYALYNKNKIAFNKIVVENLITRYPLTVILKSIRKDKSFRKTKYDHALVVYFFYQRKYKKILTINSLMIRSKLLVSIYGLRVYSSIRNCFFNCLE